MLEVRFNPVFSSKKAMASAESSASVLTSVGFDKPPPDLRVSWIKSSVESSIEEVTAEMPEEAFLLLPPSLGSFSMRVTVMLGLKEAVSADVNPANPPPTTTIRGAISLLDAVTVVKIDPRDRSLCLLGLELRNLFWFVPLINLEDTFILGSLLLLYMELVLNHIKVL